jgi:hypothetical protein
MRITRAAFTICQGLFLLLIVNVAHSRDVVGQVSAFEEERSFIYRDVTTTNVSKQEPIDDYIDIYQSDALEVKKGSELKFNLYTGGSEITVGAGRLHLLDGDDGAVLGKVEGGLTRVNDSGEHKFTLVTDLVVTDPYGTIYEVYAMPDESRVYVYDGEVAVTSTDQRFTETVYVSAGEWVRARKGQAISPKKRFIVAAGPGSGSSACIYSNCKITDDPRIPLDPVVTPQVLIPPNPNPPARR